MIQASSLVQGVVSSHADNQQLRLRENHAKSRQASHKLKQEWRRVNIEYKELDKARRSLLQKRHFVDEKSKQLSLLAELASLVAAFQMIVLYEQELPPVSDHRYADVVLALWGTSCLVVSGIDILVMFIAALLNCLILKMSTDEGDISTLPRYQHHQRLSDNIYSLTGDSKEGVIQDKARAMEFWRDECDALFIKIVRAFSYSVPAFLLNFALLGYVKFYSSPAVRWAAMLLPLLGVHSWWKCHSGLIENLLWRPPGSDREQEEAVGAGRGEGREEEDDALSQISQGTSTPPESLRSGEDGREEGSGRWDEVDLHSNHHST